MSGEKWVPTRSPLEVLFDWVSFRQEGSAFLCQRGFLKSQSEITLFIISDVAGVPGKKLGGAFVPDKDERERSYCCLLEAREAAYGYYAEWVARHLVGTLGEASLPSGDTLAQDIAPEGWVRDPRGGLICPDEVEYWDRVKVLEDLLHGTLCNMRELTAYYLRHANDFGTFTERIKEIEGVLGLVPGTNEKITPDVEGDKKC